MRRATVARAIHGAEGRTMFGPNSVVPFGFTVVVLGDPCRVGCGAAVDPAEVLVPL